MTTAEILDQFKAGKLTADDVARLLASIEKKPAARLSLKVSEKGAASLYGMGRFPVTLYAEQWERLLAFSAEIQEFLSANSDKLQRKGNA